MSVELETRPRPDPPGLLRRVLFVWFLLPVVVTYPLFYVRADEAERERRMRASPLAEVPGLSADAWWPAAAYAVAFFVPVYGLSALAVRFNPVGSAAAYAVVVAGGILVGVALTTTLHARGLDRSLLKRFAVAVLVAVVFTGIVLGSSPGVPWRPSVSLVPLLAVLVGAVVGNGYVVKREDREQALTGRVDGERHLRTDQSVGTVKDDEAGRELVAEFGHDVWSAPDDLGARSDVVRTREIPTYRDIERRLEVEERRHRKAVPQPRFRRVKARHRSDYHDREHVAPDGFTAKNYTFFVPGSEDVRTCRECRGYGQVDCRRCGTDGVERCGGCSGDGVTSCRRCWGDGAVDCRSCGGDGIVGEGDRCSACRGSGTGRCSTCDGSGGVACSTCDGSGVVTCDRCNGTGDHECGDCRGSGKQVRFEFVRRQYDSEEDVTFRRNSVPVSVLSDAEGTLARRDTDERPGEDGLYRRQEEVREIPVLATTYRYRGDTWELFEVEGDVQVFDFPRDFRKQFRVVQALAVLTIPSMAVLMFL